MSKAQILFVPHGGGPLPLLSDPAHQKLISFLKEIPSKLHQPDLILVISAHWEESNPVVFGTGEIPLLYDYYGFPEEAYQIQYPVPGSEENILILGSGFSFHNMRAFDWQNPQSRDPLNDSFQDWLISVFTASSGKQDSGEQLSNWESAPNSRYCHPREEHLLPLHVCAGLAEANAEKVFDDSILGKRSVGFLWS